MGQKINPIGLRLGINRGWDSTWFAKKKDFGKYLIEDFKIRKYIKKNIVNSGVSEIFNLIYKPIAINTALAINGIRHPKSRKSSLLNISLKIKKIPPDINKPNGAPNCGNIPNQAR